MSDSVRFTLDGSEVEAFDGETIWQVAHRLGTDIPHLCYAHEPGYRGRRQLPRVHGGGGRRTGAGRVVPAPGGARHGGAHRHRARGSVASHGDGDARRRSAGARGRAPARFEAVAVGGADGSDREPASVPARGRPRPEPPRDARQPRRLHPLQPVRAGLPRGAGQRRHRHGLPRHRLEDSSSTSTTRWVRAPASPAASACRRVRPGR